MHVNLGDLTALNLFLGGVDDRASFSVEGRVEERDTEGQILRQLRVILLGERHNFLE